MSARHTPFQPARETFSGDEAEAYDMVVARQTAYDYKTYREQIPQQHLNAYIGTMTPAGDEAAVDDRVQAYMGAMLNNPPVMALISELGVLFRNIGARGDSYKHSDREWIDMVLGQELGAWGVMYLHIPDGVANGMRIEAIRALRSGKDEDLTREELIKTRYIRQVARGTVTPESYDAIVEVFGRRGAVEFTQFIAFLILTIRLIQAFGAQDDYTSELIDELLDLIEAGEATLPDPNARIPASFEK